MTFQCEKFNEEIDQLKSTISSNLSERDLLQKEIDRLQNATFQLQVQSKSTADIQDQLITMQRMFSEAQGKLKKFQSSSGKLVVVKDVLESMIFHSRMNEEIIAGLAEERRALHDVERKHALIIASLEDEITRLRATKRGSVSNGMMESMQESLHDIIQTLQSIRPTSPSQCRIQPDSFTLTTQDQLTYSQQDSSGKKKSTFAQVFCI